MKYKVGCSSLRSYKLRSLEAILISDLQLYSVDILAISEQTDNAT